MKTSVHSGASSMSNEAISLLAICGGEDEARSIVRDLENGRSRPAQEENLFAGDLPGGGILPSEMRWCGHGGDSKNEPADRIRKERLPKKVSPLRRSGSITAR